MQKRQQVKMSELDEQLAEYIAEWRKQRAKEDEELERLKDKQAKRKVCIKFYLVLAKLLALVFVTGLGQLNRVQQVQIILRRRVRKKRLTI